MCNLQKCLIRGILSTPANDVHERLKTNGTAIKIARQSKNKYNSVKRILETTIFIHEDKYLSVSKNPESSNLKLKFMF